MQSIIGSQLRVERRRKHRALTHGRTQPALAILTGQQLAQAELRLRHTGHCRLLQQVQAFTLATRVERLETIQIVVRGRRLDGAAEQHRQSIHKGFSH